MSKRGQEFQGGEERYGGRPGGTDTPVDTPTKATAAQMAARRIATMKKPRHTTRPSSSSAFGGGFSLPPGGGSSAPGQSGFSFGQNGTNGVSTAAPFGQSQTASNTQSNTSGFNFGGAQSGGFTFGQNTQSNGGFTFGQSNGTPAAFPATGNNPFASANGTPTTGPNAPSFSGSIFNFGPAQPQPATNGFKFGVTPSQATDPQQEAQEAGKKEILRKEPYLDSEGQQRVEAIVGSSLPSDPNQYSKDPIDYLSASVITQLAEYLKSRPEPAPNASTNVESLFVRPYRRKATKPWVSNAERDEFQAMAAKLAPAEQNRIAQIVKDEVPSLSGKANYELPGIERLPNDTQRSMIESARTAGAKAPARSSPTKPSPQDAADAAPPTDEEKPKPNPFASIKLGTPSAPATSSGGFSFATPGTAAPQTKKDAPSAPSFSFEPKNTTSSAPSVDKPAATFSFGSKPAEAPNPLTTDKPAATFTFGTKPAAPSTPNPETPKPNPFASISAPSAAPSAPSSETPKPNPFANISTPSASAVKPTKPSTDATQSSSQQAATPATKPNLSFAQPAAKTPAPSSNIFSSSTAQPPPSTPSQKPASQFSFGGFTPAAKPPNSTGVFSSAAPVKAPLASVSTSKRAVESYFEFKSDPLSKIRSFNVAFLQHLQLLNTADDWSDALWSYMQEIGNIQEAAMGDFEAAHARGQKETPSSVKPAAQQTAQASAQQPKASGGFQLALPQAPAAQPVQQAAQATPQQPRASGWFQPASPQKPAARPLVQQAAQATPQQPKASSAFQLPASQKPMTATASLFNNILDTPDKAKPAPANQQVTNPSSNMFAQSQTAKLSSTPAFQLPKTSTAAPPSSSSPAFQVPKFGNAAPSANASAVPKFGGGSGSSSSFLSAFGAAAAKEAAKAKAKRKAEDFDSDEDDEAEWEAKDKEQQEAKRRQVEQSSKKVMKMVNGKYEWVDVEASDSGTGAALIPNPAQPAASVFDNRSTQGQSAANPFAHLANNSSAQEHEDDENSEEDADGEEADAPPAANGGASATPAKTGGLFDRINKSDVEARKQETSSTPLKPVFNFATSKPATDHTWKPESPIKFGGANGTTTPSGSPAKKAVEPAADSSKESVFKFNAAPPKFNFGVTAPSPAAPSNAESSKDKPFASLFPTGGASGSASPAPSIFANIGNKASTPTFSFGGQSASLTPALGPSAANSLFSSAGTSRASTPGLGTPEESSTAAGTDTEEDSAPAEPQKDLTALSPEEAEDNDVLFEQKARYRQYDGKEMANKGVGMVRLLKNKASGKARVLLRLTPSGTVVLNANLLPNPAMYGKYGEKGVMITFAETEKVLTRGAVSFGKKEEASEFLEKIKGVI